MLLYISAWCAAMGVGHNEVALGIAIGLGINSLTYFMLAGA